MKSWIIVYNPATDSSNNNFKTHLNYIKCMKRLTNNMMIKVDKKPSTNKLDAKVLKKFETLSNITEDSIRGEISACDKEKSYSQVVAPWIPVKCYYYLHYLESMFLYLYTENKGGFKPGGHT